MKLPLNFYTPTTSRNKVYEVLNKLSFVGIVRSLPSLPPAARSVVLRTRGGVRLSTCAAALPLTPCRFSEGGAG